MRATPRRHAMPGPLNGKMALVAGATRGAGRGTAVALGEAGATVYCTGRSTSEDGIVGSEGLLQGKWLLLECLEE
jgi:NAD(P)-dependent dehydrogenase (short-subunit alcohol dehydrogenase family)